MAFWNTVLNSSDDILPYGRRLIPTIVDHNAKTQPDRACFSIPRSEVLQDGFRDISWRTYANAINKTAHFIQGKIGRSSSFETVMYLGFPDLRAFLVLVALIKTGHKALFSSYHNSLAAHTELIKKTTCAILLHTAGFPVSSILEKNRLESVCLPELEDLLSSVPNKPYPYNKTFDEAKHDPCYVVHTSGSTGMPKPVVWTHWMISTADNHHAVPDLDGRPALWASVLDTRKRNYCGWPLFNGSGLGVGLMEPCFNNTTAVMGPAQPVTADVFNDMLEYADIDAASCLPSTLEETARRPGVLAKLNKLKMIVYVGGSLSPDAGDAVSRYTNLHTLMGSTETNAVVQHSTDREDWAYICINSTYNGIEMRPVADLFELVYVRNVAYADFQGVFKAYPHLHEFSMQDLYSRHPTKPHHWRHEGRKDDIIVFRNGSKSNPMVHERMIASHPAVQHALVVGTGRDKLAVIIELRPEVYTGDVQKQRNLLKTIWPIIIQANNVVETYSQLEARYVMFAKPDKPFAVGLKGVVRRKATVDLYAEEIEELYASIASGGLKALFRTEGR
ncbi:acetyl-CoA synthetase-like protein [Cucurbitaria berberidis CBS 394.84]|uniref:Acetyl-CoA synthetase-like protein n=1 Tax=Cucurbitaria berberidis CBS 394.84 TaxID=1168544 RepID=A0A9P4LBQ0_9PLEO|nr:acetyl-CoA synthetase-like protein [Cucurbitaria berberidis CBS 394.84]KAF1849275.1 acetyl-CoA synthetase-like protein [Cucurbitaria berberidis CBS 394.84]